MCFVVTTPNRGQFCYTINLGLDIHPLTNIDVDTRGLISRAELLSSKAKLRTAAFNNGTESGVLVVTGEHTDLLSGTETEQLCDPEEFAKAQRALVENIHDQDLHTEKYQHWAECRRVGHRWQTTNLSPPDQPEFVRRTIRTGGNPTGEFQVRVETQLLREPFDSVVVIARSHKTMLQQPAKSS